jgi:hypothetical protein
LLVVVQEETLVVVEEPEVLELQFRVLHQAVEHQQNQQYQFQVALAIQLQ